ncbi:hypothetical protein OL548_11300 [Lysinibacillus sp. MHQ-1]|nr:hypothetical protein OL548_11300 [Lysinibacillus sp. MHQ-1]
MPKKEGLPIEYIDPVEGNFTLTESVAVVDKEGDETLAKEMAKVIATEARNGLLEQYPVALYEGEQVKAEHVPAHLKKVGYYLNSRFTRKTPSFL